MKLFTIIRIHPVCFILRFHITSHLYVLYHTCPQSVNDEFKAVDTALGLYENNLSVLVINKYTEYDKNFILKFY